MPNNRIKPPFWHYLVPGLILAYLGYCLYNWVGSLVVHASGRTPLEIAVAIYNSVHEAAIHTSDNVGLSDLAIFAALLILAHAFYAAISSEQWRRDKQRLRLASRHVTNSVRWTLRTYAEFANSNPEEHARRSSLQHR